MRVDALIICQQVTLNRGLANIVGAGTDTFLVPAFPATVEIPVFIRVVGLPDTTERDLLVQVSDANGEMQSETIVPVQFDVRPTDLPDGWETRAMTVLKLGLTVPEPGAFLVTALIAGTPSSSHPVFIRHREPPNSG
jgi:hypothetical protein